MELYDVLDAENTKTDMELVSKINIQLEDVLDKQGDEKLNDEGCTECEQEEILILKVETLEPSLENNVVNDLTNQTPLLEDISLVLDEIVSPPKNNTHAIQTDWWRIQRSFIVSN